MWRLTALLDVSLDGSEGRYLLVERRDEALATPLSGDRLGSLAPLGEDPDDLAHATAHPAVAFRVLGLPRLT